MERSLTYEPLCRLEGQAHHLGWLSNNHRDLHCDRNSNQCGILCDPHGAGLVEGYEGLREKTVQEVNCQHGGQPGEGLQKRSLFLLFYFLMGVQQ